MIGKTISHYKILEKLGGGGMGVVYKAQDLRLDRMVALKFLPPHLSTNVEEKQRFIHEAKAASALQHHNICTIHDIDETEDGQLFIVMDCYAGETLKKKIDKGELLALDEVLDIAVQIAQGLAKAHQADIVHRDIKPANIISTDDGEVKILDFGLAKLSGQSKLTKEGTTIGTVSYMSPEQSRGEEVDQRTDIWSLAVVLYEMIAGKLPFKGDYEPATVYSILNEEQQPITALRSGVPLELERIINKCLQKAPDKRYQHIDEMAVDLAAIQKQSESSKLTTQSVTTTASKRKPVYLYAGIALLLALVVLLAIYFWPEQRQPINSIAVLLQEKHFGDSEQAYFADGMVEKLTIELSKIGALIVRPWTSSKRYKNTEKSLREIAEELQVGALVVVSPMLAGDNIRSAVNLIEADTDKLLWGEVYERDFRDVLSLQKDVALAIAGEINLVLTPQDEARIGEAQAVDPAAYDLYLRGRHILDRSSERERALEYLEQSAAIDPNYAPAYADMIVPLFFLAENSLSVDEAELKARRAAARALQLDDRLAEAHVAMGMVQESFDLDWPGAEQSFRRAIQLNPKSRDAHLEYGWLLLRLRRFEEALAEIEIQRTLEDPLSLNPHVGFIWIYYASRQYDQAIEWCRKGLELDSTAALLYGYLGLTYLAMGEYENAVTFVQKAMYLVESLDPLLIGNMGHVYALAGMRAKALKLLDDLQASWQQGGKALIAWGITAIHIGLGQNEKALTWLERAHAMRNPAVNIHLKVWPQWESLHDEPRFKALLKKMNFEVDE